MKKSHVALWTCVLSLLCASAHAGHQQGNGGDGDNDNGQVVLRDLSGGVPMTLVSDKAYFLSRVPDFQALLQDISRASPIFAASIVTQLLDANLYVTQQPLPLLPDQWTGVLESNAQVQIAIRYDNDILLSLPAFEKTEQALLLLHEALHGLVGGEGPIHHDNVRAIVQGISEHRKTLDAIYLQDLEFNYDLKIPTQNLPAQYALTQAFQAVDQGLGSVAARRAILGLFANDEITPSERPMIRLLHFFFDFAPGPFGIDNPDPGLLAELTNLFPGLKGLLGWDQPIDPDSLINSWQIKPGAPSLLSCLNIAGSNLPGLETQLSAMAVTGNSELADLAAATTALEVGDSDPALSALAGLLLTTGTLNPSTSFFEGKLLEKLQHRNDLSTQIQTSIAQARAYAGVIQKLAEECGLNKAGREPQ